MHSKLTFRFVVTESKWVVISLFVGLIAGYAVYAVAPKYYEGSMVLSPATYGTVGGDKAVAVENPQLTAQIIQSKSFLDPQLEQNCVGSIRTTIMPRTEFVRVFYRSKDAQTLMMCLDRIFAKFDRYQAELAKPIVDNIAERSRTLTAQIEEAKKTTRSLEQKLINQNLTTASALQTTLLLNILTNNYADIKATEKHVDQLNLALSPNYTHDARAVDVVVGDQEPVFPQKNIVIILTGAAFAVSSLVCRYFLLKRKSRAKQ